MRDFLDCVDGRTGRWVLCASRLRFPRMRSSTPARIQSVQRASSAQDDVVAELNIVPTSVGADAVEASHLPALHSNSATCHLQSVMVDDRGLVCFEQYTYQVALGYYLLVEYSVVA